MTNHVARATLARMKTFTRDQAQAALKNLPDWKITGGESLALHREYSRATFAEAIAFVNVVARLAEDADHHPDIDIRFIKVSLTLSTHSARGLTEKDFDLARQIDAAENDASTRADEREAQLQRALDFATRAHFGQTDKAGKDYIEHPKRVSSFCRTHEAKIAALLHDTIEDCDVMLEDLRALDLPESSLEAVALLTKKDGDDYESYIRRIAAHAVARETKLADLRDNMNLSRLENPTEKDFARLEKYRGAKAILESASTRDVTSD